MHTIAPTKTIAGLLLFTLLLAAPASAEEGMWTFDNPPRSLLKERYGFEPDQAWLDHVRLSSVRFMDGGSGAFVGSRGLVATNHHVVAGQLHKVSTAKRNWFGRPDRNVSSRSKNGVMELNAFLLK